MVQILAKDGQWSMDVLPVLNDLDTGIVHHLAWFKHLHRALVCDAQFLPDDLRGDAHLCCRFGRWYHREGGHPEFEGLPAFGVIGELHQGMHDLARELLLMKQAGQPISCEDYDRFMERAIAFKLAIRHLQYELVRSICVVDPLTGAWNRHGMYARLAEEQERIARSGEPCCLCMLDLDHFKFVNDTFGHPAGDEVLKATVKLVTAGLRKYDTVYRYGGEEFLICMPRTSLEMAEATLERLRQRLEATPVVLKDGRAVAVTASFGLAPMLGGMEIQEVLEAVDYSLLSAKGAGRNRICVWGRRAAATGE